MRSSVSDGRKKQHWTAGTLHNLLASAAARAEVAGLCEDRLLRLQVIYFVDHESGIIGVAVATRPAASASAAV